MIEVLQFVTAVGRVVMSLLHQSLIAGVPRLPQQVLLVRSLSEAGVPESLRVVLLHLPLQLLQAAREVRAEAVLDIVADLEVGGPPLDVVFMSRFQIIQRITHLENKELDLNIMLVHFGW